MSPSGNVPPSAGKARSGPYLPGTRSLRVGEASVSSPTHPNTVAAAGRVTPSQKREMMWRNALARLPARRCYTASERGNGKRSPPRERVCRGRPAPRQAALRRFANRGSDPDTWRKNVGKEFGGRDWTALHSTLEPTNHGHFRKGSRLQP